MAMELLTQTLKAKLLKNHRLDGVWPPVKFFDPCGSATWLIASMDSCGDRLFGLCDLGMGFPELGYVSLRELQAVKGRYGLGLERDLHFRPTKTLLQYAEEARAACRILA